MLLGTRIQPRSLERENGKQSAIAMYRQPGALLSRGGVHCDAGGRAARGV